MLQQRHLAFPLWKTMTGRSCSTRIRSFRSMALDHFCSLFKLRLGFFIPFNLKLAKGETRQLAKSTKSSFHSDSGEAKLWSDSNGRDDEGDIVSKISRASVIVQLLRLRMPGMLQGHPSGAQSLPEPEIHSLRVNFLKPLLFFWFHHVSSMIWSKFGILQ